MKYYSRSPEEWRKIDEEKRKRDRIPELRRRSWMYFFVNLILVGAVVIMIGLYRLKSTVPFSLYLKTSDEYELGSPVDFEIRIVNTRGDELGLTVDYLSVRLLTISGSPVSARDVSPSLSVKIPPYSYVVLYEGHFDVPDPGDYKIEVTLRTDLGKLTVVKDVTVRDPVNVIIGGYEPYHILGERPSYEIVVHNGGSVSRKVQIGMGEVYVKKGEMVLDSRIFRGFSAELPPGGARLIMNYSPPISLNEKGMYKIGVETTLNGRKYDEEMAFMVVDRSEVGMKDVSILFDYYEKGGGIEIDLYLVNNSDEHRFFEVKSAVLMVYSSEGTKSESTEGVRVWIPPNGKILLLGRIFDLGDIKGLRAVVESGGNVIKKEIGGGW